jgi:Putative zincin peptidase
MRIHFGNIPPIADAQPEAEGLHPIRGPRASAAYLLAGLAGFLLLCGPVMGLCLLSSLFAVPGTEAAPSPDPPAPWGAILLTLLLYIPVHELFHLICQPHLGFSDQSVLVIWPSRLRFGIYYDGCMSRTRWLLMRSAPLIALSLIPAVVLAILQNSALDHALRTSLEVLLVVNGVGSGGDAVAMILVLRQVPSSAYLCFRGGRAYWQPAQPESRGV